MLGRVPFDSMANDELSLELHNVERGPTVAGVQELVLHTGSGAIPCRLHAADAGDAAVVWVGGAGGGLDGPAGGLYPSLAEHLLQDQIASLRLHYRQPNRLTECVLDTLLGVAYLGMEGHARVALVGHSFGGAVVITAGAVDDGVVGVVAMSSQTFGTRIVHEVSPRPLLLMHGTADEILPDACSRDIYARAREPKQILLYDGCRHGLDECREAVDRDLLGWLRQVLRPQP